ncbi:GNAT family N-acetyltransferase [Acaryochloris marina]|uniref:GNAT family N-acetyltransferase n=1 Tax=Acaryochloris marina TaxID=155978 RepID=UPI0020171AA2|nr:GNAT family N-acetyltransferase [Acaryochloris marina]
MCSVHCVYLLSSRFYSGKGVTYTAAQINQPQYHFFLGEREHNLIGFYGLEQLSAQEMELIALFVSPTSIGQGYGRHLINHAKRHAVFWGTQSILIQSDPNAEAFYLTVGAYRIGQTESESIPDRFLPLLKLDLLKD